MNGLGGFPELALRLTVVRWLARIKVIKICFHDSTTKHVCCYLTQPNPSTHLWKFSTSHIDTPKKQQPHKLNTPPLFQIVHHLTKQHPNSRWKSESFCTTCRTGDRHHVSRTTLPLAPSPTNASTVAVKVKILKLGMIRRCEALLCLTTREWSTTCWFVESLQSR